ASEVAARLNRAAPFIWLARRIPHEQADAAEALGFEGVGAVSEYKRFYPESNLAASVVGLAGMDGQGLSGLELQYDPIIRGEPMSVRIDRDALGHAILDSPMALTNPPGGAELELTIDSEIQRLAESRLADEIKESGAKRGSAIVLDPFTGEVLAMAVGSAEGADRQDRLHNAAVQDAFEPGSTAKGILGAIALDDRVITTHQKIFCHNGQVTIGGRQVHDHSPHGWLDLQGIIQVSSNIGAAKIAMLLGSQRYRNGLAAFGLGRPTGIDLPGEASGLLRPASKWAQIDLADHGFGQGIAVTAVQLAVAYAAIANGGLVMRPYLVRAAYDCDGKQILEHTPQVLRRAVSPSAAHTMNLLLRSVVDSEEGTGRKAAVDDFIVAGKTGTAQMINPETGGYYQSRLVASFVGFVPADNPRLVILVVLEDVNHGHFGGLYAAPVFSEIASGALSHLNVASLSGRAVESAGIIPFASDSETFAAPVPALSPLAPGLARASSIAPNFLRLSIRDAICLARRSGVEIESAGSGYVILQKPAPGERLAHASVRLKLSSDDPSGLAPDRIQAVPIATEQPPRIARR
ncbi:MAG TPA: penicillin-binding transpeptidase domain-containing protein, partial [Candidatus Binataceae bacterium]